MSLSPTPLPLRYLCRNEVQEICRTLDPVALVEDAFRLHATGDTDLPAEAYLSLTNDLGEGGRSLNMPGRLGGKFQAAGTKIINSNLGNPARGLPRASGLTLLFDPITAQVVCVMEGGYISALRTAAVTALSVRLLSGPTIETLAIIGSGELAEMHLRLLVADLPHLRRITLYDTNAQRAAVFPERRATSTSESVGELLNHREITLSFSPSAEEAVRPAQLVIPVTTTTMPYIKLDWLQPGALLVNVSLDDAEEDVLLGADKLFVDSWELITADNNRLLGKLARAGKVTGPREPTVDKGKRAVNAEIGELVLGTQRGRESNTERIVVNPFGVALTDIAIGATVVDVATKTGSGVLLER